MRNRWLSGAAVALLIAGGLLGVGCSSDDSEPDQGQNTGGAGGGDTDAGEDDAGDNEEDAGTDSGDEEDSGSETDGGDDPQAGSEACGTVTCEGVVAGGIFALDGCCVDEATEACGLIIPAPIGNGSCVAKDQPGKADENCEDYVLEFGSLNVTLPGCCTPAGTCGYATNGTQLETLGIALGCVNPEDIGLEVDGGPASCTYSDDDPDAGDDPDSGDDDPDAGDEDPDAGAEDPDAGDEDPDAGDEEETP